MQNGYAEMVRRTVSWFLSRLQILSFADRPIHARMEHETTVLAAGVVFPSHADQRYIMASQAVP